jgi:hypothetical protein
VPDRDTAPELPRGPRALPSKGDDHD